MNCTKCNIKACRQTNTCASLNFQTSEVLAEYAKDENQSIVKAAAKLVDNGRAGTLSRLQEIIEFSKEMNYERIGLAYCYGMEMDASLVAQYIKSNGFKVSAVSCTAGGMAQNEVNKDSQYSSVSCNPISQATQLNNEGVDFTISFGLCLGHDILFNRYIKTDHTNLLVKDRVFNHNPLEEIKNIKLIAL